jgi:hypothetical protein
MEGIVEAVLSWPAGDLCCLPGYCVPALYQEDDCCCPAKLNCSAIVRKCKQDADCGDRMKCCTDEDGDCIGVGSCIAYSQLEPCPPSKCDCHWPLAQRPGWFQVMSACFACSNHTRLCHSIMASGSLLSHPGGGHRAVDCRQCEERELQSG